MSLASLRTDHTLALVAGAQMDYSQSLQLPKRPSSAEWQEWLPGSLEDASARTAWPGLQDLPCHPHPPWAPAARVPGCQEG